MRNRKVWVSFVSLSIAILALVPVFYALNLDWLFDYLITFPLIGLLCGSAFVWIKRDQMRKEIRIELRHTGLPICIKCGYDLISIENSLCSECGFDNYTSVDHDHMEST
jgi:hypothetical protein